MKEDLRILGRVALLAVGALIAVPLIFILLVMGSQTGQSPWVAIVVIVAFWVWLAYLAFAPKPGAVVRWLSRGPTP